MKKTLSKDKISITITGDSPYEIREEMQYYINGVKALRFLDEWENFMRSEVKYKDNEMYEKVREEYFKIKEMFDIEEI